MTPALKWASAEDENAALRDQQQRLEAAVDRLVAGGTRYPPKPPTAQPPGQRARPPVHLPAHPRRAGHQLALRIGGQLEHYIRSACEARRRFSPTPLKNV